MGARPTLAVAVRAVGLAMAAVTLALVAIDAGDAGAWAIFLAIGLFAVAVAPFIESRPQ